MFPYQFTAFFLKVNSWSLEDARFNTKVADTQSRGFFSSQGNVADPVRWNTSKINYSVPNSPSSPWRMWPIRRKSCTEIDQNLARDFHGSPRITRLAYIIKPEDLGSVNIGHLSNFFTSLATTTWCKFSSSLVPLTGCFAFYIPNQLTAWHYYIL